MAITCWMILMLKSDKYRQISDYVLTKGEIDKGTTQHEGDSLCKVVKEKVKGLKEKLT